MDELLGFVTVFDTHMCGKEVNKTSEIQETKLFQTGERKKKNIIVFARRSSVYFRTQR